LGKHPEAVHLSFTKSKSRGVKDLRHRIAVTFINSKFLSTAFPRALNSDVARAWLRAKFASPQNHRMKIEGSGA
jgi:hypothetical protein